MTNKNTITQIKNSNANESLAIIYWFSSSIDEHYLSKSPDIVISCW